MRNRSLVFIVAALAGLLAARTQACAVAPSENVLWDTETSQAWADVVALVRVASSTQTEQGAARVELIVEHTWKGKVGARWTFTQHLGSTCDYPLLRNVRYVIFAKRQEDGKVSVTAVADGALGIVRDRLSAAVMPPPSLREGTAPRTRKR